MLERYYFRPDTIDRIRTSWLGEPIERYVAWLAENGYAARNVFYRVPILRHFAEFSKARGAQRYEDLPILVTPFAAAWEAAHGRNCKSEQARKKVADTARNAVEQMPRLVLKGFVGTGRKHWAREPFADSAPGFFDYLRQERGLRETSVVHYRHYLQRFEKYLSRNELAGLHELSPVLLSGYVVESSRSMCHSERQALCSTLRVFIRYLWRTQLIPRDLSDTIEPPKTYRLAKIPRSITWDEVRRMLAAVDRRTHTGKRDYAILLLLITYGLRAREVAELTLDNVDWTRERLLIPERKAGHSTAYPLSSMVGQSIIDYVQVLPKTEDRHLFFGSMAPYRPYTHNAIASRVTHYLHRAVFRSPAPDRTRYGIHASNASWIPALR